MIKNLNAIDAPMSVVQLRVLGGAMSQVLSDATAYAYRTSPILGNVAAFLKLKRKKRNVKFG